MLTTDLDRGIGSMFYLSDPHLFCARPSSAVIPQQDESCNAAYDTWDVWNLMEIVEAVCNKITHHSQKSMETAYEINQFMQRYVIRWIQNSTYNDRMKAMIINLIKL